MNTMGNEQFGSIDSVSGLTEVERKSILGGPGRPNLEKVVQGIKGGKYKNIIVLCGAGISVSAGIPDFRSPKTGLYHNLQKYDLPDPQSIFELGFFRKNPVPFFTLAREIYPSLFTPTPTHRFLELLDKKGLLLRVYTQNIDTLERLTGIREDKIVECHGSFASNTCQGCQKVYPQSWMKYKLFECPKVSQDEEGIPYCDDCGAVVKPDITFFGEDLPEIFTRRLKPDLKVCDLLFVIGTSLQVFPVAGIVDQVPKTCPRVLINREMVHTANCTGQIADDGSLIGALENTANGVENELVVSEDGFWWGSETLEAANYRDVFCPGDSDDTIREICTQLGWADDLAALVLMDEGEAVARRSSEASSTHSVAGEKDLISLMANLTTAQESDGEEQGGGCVSGLGD